MMTTPTPSESAESPVNTPIGTATPDLTAERLTIRVTTGSTAHDIIEDLDLSVGPGGMTVLFGRSGSGKTTILRAMSGLISPTSGTIRWRGESIAGLHQDELTRRRAGFLGYADQQSSLIPRFTALENVLLAAVPGHQVKRRAEAAEELLARVGLSERSHHRVDVLSGGERQRVCLVRALLMDPAVLVADEPTASLDRATADSIITLLAERAAQGRTVLTASHDLHVVQATDHSVDVERIEEHSALTG